MAKKKATKAKKKITTASPPRPRDGKRPRPRGLGAGSRSRLQRDTAGSNSVAIRSRKNTHIKGNVAGRDNIIYNITKVIQMAAFTPPPDLKKLRKDYLEHLHGKGYKAASTTIAGQFSEGNSELGLTDMNGNIGEWTSSWTDDGYFFREVRGGSHSSSRRGCRTTSCFSEILARFGPLGFRIVRSPSS